MQPPQSQVVVTVVVMKVVVVVVVAAVAAVAVEAIVVIADKLLSAILPLPGMTASRERTLFVKRLTLANHTMSGARTVKTAKCQLYSSLQ